MPRPGHTRRREVRKLEGMAVRGPHAMTTPGRRQLHARAAVPGGVTHFEIKQVWSPPASRNGLGGHKRRQSRATAEMLVAAEAVVQWGLDRLCQRPGQRGVTAAARFGNDRAPPGPVAYGLKH